jgi:lysophospholipase L1-like esterase
VAEEFGLPFVPLQEKMNALAAITENSYILHDGVHPTPAGHQLITNALYEVLTPIL